MSYREPQGEARWAKFDHFDTRVRAARYVHQSSWFGVWIYLLKIKDYESAEIVWNAHNKNTDQTR